MEEEPVSKKRKGRSGRASPAKRGGSNTHTPRNATSGGGGSSSSKRAQGPSPGKLERLERQKVAEQIEEEREAREAEAAEAAARAAEAREARLVANEEAKRKIEAARQGKEKRDYIN